MPSVRVFGEACKGVEDCGICLFVCPKSLFSASQEMNEAGYVPPLVTDEAECTSCKNCMVFCPDFAIVVEGETEDSREDIENG